MNQTKTNRGFVIFDFKDDSGAECSLQKSSSVFVDRIWLGTSVDRMHLNREQVRQLLPLLQKFASIWRTKITLTLIQPQPNRWGFFMP